MINSETILPKARDFINCAGQVGWKPTLRMVAKEVDFGSVTGLSPE